MGNCLASLAGERGDAMMRNLRGQTSGTGLPVPREHGAARQAQLDALRLLDTSKPLQLAAPIRIYSEQNERCHWATKARRVKGQRNAVAAILAQEHARRWIDANRGESRLRVTLTRLGRRRMDNDGVVAGFKATRDEIARTFCIDDGRDVWDWRYDQRVGKVFGMTIEIATL